MTNSSEIQHLPNWLDEALKDHQQDLARRLEKLFERLPHEPASLPISRAQSFGAGAEMAWKAAIDAALEVLGVKYAELSSLDRAASAGLALEQVASELLSAKKRYGSYSPPDRLDRRKRYVQRALPTKPRTPTTIREAILALVPTPGATEKVAAIKDKLVADKAASNAISVLNEIKRLIGEGVLVPHRQKGGRSVERAKPNRKRPSS